VGKIFNSDGRYLEGAFCDGEMEKEFEVLERFRNLNSLEPFWNDIDDYKELLEKLILNK